MATVHKRKLRSGDVVWELTHGTGADRQRFTVGHSREEAQDALNRFNQQLALHGSAPANDSVDAAIGRYMLFLKSNRRHGTLRRYARVLQTFGRCFIPCFHPEVRRLREIRPAHIEEYKQLRLEGGITEPDDDDDKHREQMLLADVGTGLKAPTRHDNARFGWLGRKRLHNKITPRTVNYELQVLRTFFNWCVRHNYLFVNPGTLVERCRISRRVLPKFLSVEQLKRLFEACDETERRLFMSILLSGMRRGEAENLTWSDIHFDLGVIFIQEKAWGWKPKTDERVIPISEALRNVLQAQYDQRRDDTLVFPNKEGKLDTHILEKLKKVSRRAGLLAANVHALRHSFGAHLRMAGVSLADIADLLGHKDLATTHIYAKVHQEHLRAAVAKLAPAVGQADPTTDNTAPEQPPRTGPRKSRQLLNR